MAAQALADVGALRSATAPAPKTKAVESPQPFAQLMQHASSEAKPEPTAAKAPADGIARQPSNTDTPPAAAAPDEANAAAPTKASAAVSAIPAPAEKPLTKPMATTLAKLRAAALPAATATTTESLEPAPTTLPNLASGVAVEKPIELPTATDPAASTATALPAATPEQFLSWLDSLKALGDKLPSRASSDELFKSLSASFSKAPTAMVSTEALPTSAALSLLAPPAELATAPAGTADTAAAAFALLPTNPPLQNANTAVAAAPTSAASGLLAMDNADWPQQLGGEIQWRLGAGIQEARIEISPRELGAVDVRLSMDDNGLRVHLTAAHASTRELLQAELPRLRETLQQGGLQVADAQVGRESPGQSQGRDTARGANSPGRSGQPDGEAIGGIGTAVTPRVVLLRRGLLDDYA